MGARKQTEKKYPQSENSYLWTWPGAPGQHPLQSKISSKTTTIAEVVAPFQFQEQKADDLTRPGQGPANYIILLFH